MTAQRGWIESLKNCQSNLLRGTSCFYFRVLFTWMNGRSTATNAALSHACLLHIGPFPASFHSPISIYVNCPCTMHNVICTHQAVSRHYLDYISTPMCATLYRLNPYLCRISLLLPTAITASALVGWTYLHTDSFICKRSPSLLISSA